MRGGRVETRPIGKAKPSHPNNITFNSFALSIITKSIAHSLMSMTMPTIPNISGGTGSFQKNFERWLKIEVDPFHDFGKTGEHIGYAAIREEVRTNLLIRAYNDIFQKHPREAENLVLIKLLQDFNAPHGISLKYTRFYAIPSGKDSTTRSIWDHIENGFDRLNNNASLKLYLMNAALQKSGHIELPIHYISAVPLPLRWDSVSSKNIDLTIVNDSDRFYDSIYDDVTSELYDITKIRLRVHEDTTNPENVVPKVVLELAGQLLELALSKNGFSKTVLKTAIDALVGGYIIDEVHLNRIAEFLATNGATQQDIISVFLTIKMSGDVGCVKFCKSIEETRAIKLRGKEIEIGAADPPIIFLYTGDMLCAANAIVHDTKCVFKCRPSGTSKSYFGQFLGSQYQFEISWFIEPYYERINEACQIAGISKTYDFRTVPDDDKLIHLPQIYAKLFAIVMKQNAPSLPAITMHDEFVRYVIGIVALLDFKDRLKEAIKYILKKHIKKLKTEVTLLHLNHLHHLDKFYKSSGVFDPLLQFFVEAINVPNDYIQSTIHKYIREILENELKIVITDNPAFGKALVDSPDNGKSDNAMDIAEDGDGIRDHGMEDPIAMQALLESARHKVASRNSAYSRAATAATAATSASKPAAPARSRQQNKQQATKSSSKSDSDYVPSD